MPSHNFRANDVEAHKYEGRQSIAQVPVDPDACQSEMYPPREPRVHAHVTTRQHFAQEPGAELRASSRRARVSHIECARLGARVFASPHVRARVGIRARRFVQGRARARGTVLFSCKVRVPLSVPSRGGDVIKGEADTSLSLCSSGV